MPAKSHGKKRYVPKKQPQRPAPADKTATEDTGKTAVAALKQVPVKAISQPATQMEPPRLTNLGLELKKIGIITGTVFVLLIILWLVLR